jgi:hypothetical protein
VRVEVLVELMREERLERDEREGCHADPMIQVDASDIWT